MNRLDDLESLTTFIGSVHRMKEPCEHPSGIGRTVEQFATALPPALKAARTAFNWPSHLAHTPGGIGLGAAEAERGWGMIPGGRSCR
jgi:hypothetical protein